MYLLLPTYEIIMAAQYRQYLPSLYTTQDTGRTLATYDVPTSEGPR